MMVQKFIICVFTFHGKFMADEKGPADLKMYIKCYQPAEAGIALVTDERDVIANVVKQSGLDHLGPIVAKTCDTLEDAEKWITDKQNNPYNDAFFILPIYEVKTSPTKSAE